MPHRSKRNPESPGSLRRRAEAVWESRHAESGSTDLEKDPARLLHELQVHQIELELQNEELRRSRSELEAAHEGLLELYDLAPVGYATLDRNTVILKANLKAASMLGVERAALTGQNFRRYCAVGAEAASFWRSWNEGSGQTCELRLRRKDGTEFDALVETAAPVWSGAKLLRRCAITDISARKRTESTLAANEEKYRALIETTDTGYHILDSQGTVLDANQVYVRLTGHEKLEEILGRSVLDWAAPYDREKKAEALTRCIREGFVRDLVIDYVGSNNRVTPVEINAKAVGGEESTRIIALCRDITERRRAESALRESEERFRNIADTCPAIIWYGDPDQQITFLNKQAAIFAGRNREELLGANWAEYVHPDDRESLFSTMSSAVADRSRFQAEFRLLRHDGEYRWMLDTGVPRFIGDVYIGHIGIVDDITELRQNQEQVREQLERLVNERAQQLKDANARLLEEIAERKQTEEALRDSRAKLAAALASMADAVIITDAQGNFLDFNEAVVKFCRFERKEECPKALAESFEVFDLLLPDGTPAARDTWALSRALRGETASSAEYTYRRKDTGETWIGSISFAPIRDKDGGIQGAVFVARDVTEQRRIEERQRHIQKLESVGVLAGGIAHDFNNLLTSILGNASILQMDAALGQNRRLATIIESSERAAALTRQLLAYAGKGHFEITDFDLSRLVRSSADLIRVSIPKNIDLHLDVPTSLPLVRGDASQIQQVVMNLVINAAEAIGGNAGKVNIRARIRDFDDATAIQVSPDLAAGRHISLQVEDNGCGMDATTKAKLFDPFFTTKFTGRGLGLAAVQGILRAHKGAIQVESAIGRGSTFTIYLPVSEALAGARIEGRDARKTGVPTATVLVVDDEEPVRSFMQAALEISGYRVLIAGDGRQAENVLNSADVDLVLLDIVMPVLGGAESLYEMRKHWPDLAFLVVSGYSRVEAEHLGIPPDIPFLQKPYTIETLASAVDRALQPHVRKDRR
jgi:two-component system, cell cycle sensor histidine kinase and response regulator CckA